MEDWNLEEALARLKASNPGGGRKLSLSEQCSCFALMYGGARNIDVAKAFGISTVTASYIAGCLEEDPKPVRSILKFHHSGAITEEPYGKDHNFRRNPNRIRRYEDVAREFEALGEAEFNLRYLTKAVYNRLAASRAGVTVYRPTGGRPKDFSNMSGKEIAAWRDDHEPGWRDALQSQPQTQTPEEEQ